MTNHKDNIQLNTVLRNISLSGVRGTISRKSTADSSDSRALCKLSCKLCILFMALSLG